MKSYIYTIFFVLIFGLGIFLFSSVKSEAYYYSYYPLNTNYYGDPYYRYGGFNNSFNVSYYPSYGYYDYRSTNNYNNYYPYGNYDPYNYVGNYNYSYNNYRSDNYYNYNNHYNNNNSYYRGY